MPDPIPGGGNAQFRALFRSLVVDPDMLLGRVASAEWFAQVVARHVIRARDRIYTAPVTLALLLSQVLADDQSCRAAVARLLAWRAARGLPPCPPDTGGYCEARGRLPEPLLPQLVRDTADRLQERAPDGWLSHGRRVVIADPEISYRPSNEKQG